MDSFLQQFYQLQNRIATLPVLVALLLFYPLFPFFLLPQIFAGSDLAPLDITLGYGPTEVYWLFDQMGSALRDRYFVGTLTLDVVYPLYYATAACLGLAFVLSRRYPPNARLQHLRMLPLILLVLDVTENLQIACLLQAYPDRLEFLVITTNMATLAKWAFALMTIVAVVYHWVVFLNRGGLSRQS